MDGLPFIDDKPRIGIHDGPRYRPFHPKHNRIWFVHSSRVELFNRVKGMMMEVVGHLGKAQVLVVGPGPFPGPSYGALVIEGAVE